MNQREAILSLFQGRKPPTAPAFSGLIHVTTEGLQDEGLIFHEVHHNAGKLAKAAASTYRLSGLPSAVLPLDLYVEAEALGAEIDFRENTEFSFPQVRKAGFSSAKSLVENLSGGSALLEMGRIRLVCEAIGRLKEDVGRDVVIGGMIPGPYTLLLLAVDAGKMFVEMKKDPQSIVDALQGLGGMLAEVGAAYRNAGADFITIHDMGGSPAFIGPARYEQFVFPSEKSLIEKLSGPRVLSVCGNVTNSLPLLAETGAGAISIDQTVDLHTARGHLKNTLLFGNIDPVGTFLNGTPAQVRDTALEVRETGVDAIWPGCDLVLQTPIENLRVLS